MNLVLLYRHLGTYRITCLVFIMVALQLCLHLLYRPHRLWLSRRKTWSKGIPAESKWRVDAHTHIDHSFQLLRVGALPGGYLEQSRRLPVYVGSLRRFRGEVRDPRAATMFVRRLLDSVS